MAELAQLEADFEKEKAQRNRLMDQLTSLKEDMKNLVNEKETVNQSSCCLQVIDFVCCSYV